MVRTDLGALKWLMNFKDPAGQTARRIKILGIYDLEVEHRQGRNHGNADGLSRRPCSNCTHCERDERREQCSNEQNQEGEGEKEQAGDEEYYCATATKVKESHGSKKEDENNST